MYQNRRKRQLGEMSTLKVVAVLGVLALMAALLLLMAPDTDSSVGVWEMGEPGTDSHDDLTDYHPGALRSADTIPPPASPST